MPAITEVKTAHFGVIGLGAGRTALRHFAVQNRALADGANRIRLFRTRVGEFRRQRVRRPGEGTQILFLDGRHIHDGIVGS